MFTGIIQHLGRVKKIEKHDENILLQINIPKFRTSRGVSLAVNGVCLTVASAKKSLYAFSVVPETVSRTNLSRLHAGDTVNIEPSLRYGDRLGGHLVLGHVDTTSRLTRLVKNKKGVRLTVKFSPKEKRLIAPKGSIALDGVSLTIAHVSGSSCTVALVPYTLQATTLGSRHVGDFLNVEFDIIAKYAYGQK